MSQFYDQASLVMVPSGYKDGKLYSQKPLSTSGELSFSRASNATRVVLDASGQQRLEKVRTNAITYSQDFSNWTQGAVNVTTSATANPLNGALNAQDITPTATLGVHRVLQTGGIANSLSTWSVYAKAKGYNFITIVENGNTGANVSFNLSTGAVGQQNSAVGQIESLGNGWYRCSIIHTTVTTPRFDIYISPTDSLSAYTADGTSGVTLFAAQAETGDIATDYIATTSAAVSVGPVSGLPRLDYSGGASCPSLLLEPQRTNLVTYSEQMDNAAWTLSGATITANNAISPDGYNSADLFTSTSASGMAYQVKTLSGAHTISAFFKGGTSVLARLQFYDSGAGTSAVGIYNLSTLSVSATGLSSTGTITNYGNGWYRCTLTASLSGSAINCFVGLDENAKTILAWGAQLEAGAYATSYIPTLSSAVTRVADAASKTGISSLIGQTEGTIFIQVESNEHISELSDGTSTNRIVFYTDGSEYLRNLIRSGGSTSSNIQTNTTIQAGDKIAMAYANNDSVIYKNGVKIGSDTTVTVPATSKVNVGSDYNGGLTSINSVNQFILFPTRLSNADLATLTTL